MGAGTIIANMPPHFSKALVLSPTFFVSQTKAEMSAHQQDPKKKAVAQYVKGID